MKKNLVFIITLIITLLILFGISESIYAFDWAKYEIQVKNETEKEKSVQLNLHDNKGNSFKLTYFGKEPEAKIMETVYSLYERFFKWKHIKIKTLDFTIKNNQIDAIVIPKQYVYENMNLTDHLPAGMMFTFQKKLSYNFRIENKKIFVRVKNRYLDEDRLSKDIYAAISNPMLYIEKNDPEYFYRQLERLREKYTELREEHDKMVYGIINLRSEGVMRSEAIEKNVIARIIEIKKDTPEITIDQLENQLKNENLKVSDDVVHDVLSLYYNDFKK
ncbi:hypothetical protein KKA14_19300 [bacterium]|nr:hypothetical protein [bacterium]